MRLAALLLTAAACAAPLHAQTSGVVGDWRDADGSIIRIAPCNDALCATLIGVTTKAPAKVDGNNPDASLRTRPLCGLVIGSGFRGESADKATGGKLYDPNNGKTYNGTITSNGDTLSLRGFIGVSLFGRTAKWTRVSSPVTSCRA